MPSRFQYILALLILIIVYLVYLVIYYKYQDFQVNTYMENIETENVRLYDTIQSKKEYLATVQTNAYTDRIMKASQNRMNPGEEAIFLVDQKEVSNYVSLDTSTIIAAHPVSSPTDGMNNRQKWAFYLFDLVP